MPCTTRCWFHIQRQSVHQHSYSKSIVTLAYTQGTNEDIRFAKILCLLWDGEGTLLPVANSVRLRVALKPFIMRGLLLGRRGFY